MNSFRQYDTIINRKIKAGQLKTELFARMDFLSDTDFCIIKEENGTLRRLYV